MKKNVLIYPFDRTGLTILQQRFHPEDWSITAAVAPNGWGYRGKDSGEIDYCEKNGIVIEADYEQALNKVDIVLFMKTDTPLDYEKNLKPKMLMAARKRKSAVCTLDLYQDELEFWKNQFSSNESFFEYCNTNLDVFQCEDISDGDIKNPRSPLLHEITVPVLMIFSFMENLSKFDVQLNAMHYFQERGYKPALITSKSFGQLGGVIPPKKSSVLK